MAIPTKETKKLIDYVENTPKLKKLKVDMYLDLNKTGYFGTAPKYYRFSYLFESMRRNYINDFVCAGDVLQLSTQGMKDFCQYFVDEYEEVKNTLPKVYLAELK